MTLDEIIVAKEGERFEFKEAKHSFSFDKLLQYLCAYSNLGGGHVVFGVSDLRPRQVVGSMAFEQPERVRRTLIDKLKVGVDFELFNEGTDRRVLMFTVAGRPVGLPVMADGIAWWRDGDSLVPMPPDEMRLIFAEAAKDFSADICEGACLGDLDPRAIAEFRTLWMRKSGIEEMSKWSDEKMLYDSEAVTARGVTNAAIALFGRHEAVCRLLPQAEIIYEYRDAEEPGPADNRVEFREGFFGCYDALWNEMAKHNTLQHYQDRFSIPDIPTFDERIVREIVLNAVSHRDYQLAPSVFIRQYRDRIEVDSPGGLPADVTVENILDRQSPRNRRIADLFSKAGFVERAGQGMDIIYNRSIRQAKALPDFSGTDRMHVRVTHVGIVEDPQLVAMMHKIGVETLKGFSVGDLLVVHNVRKKKPIPNSLQRNLERVLETGLIERSGHGRYILGRRYYGQIGHRGAYTREKGLKADAIKALMLQHITENNEVGSPFSDFTEAFPAMSRSTLQRLLRQMKDAKEIMVVGSRRVAKWYIYDAGFYASKKQGESIK